VAADAAGEGRAACQFLLLLVREAFAATRAAAHLLLSPWLPLLAAGGGDDSRSSSVLALLGLGLLVVTWYSANIYFNM
jgi:hypothetical protein